MANGGFYASSMAKSEISKEDNITDETPENQTSDMLMTAMMPAASIIKDYQNANHQSSNQASDSISKGIESSNDNSTKNDVAKKVAKTNVDNNFGILAIIVILLICLAVGYKKFN